MRDLLSRLIPALVLLGALTTVGLFHAWQRVEGIRLGYRLGEVTAEHQALLRKNEHLRLEVATLKAPGRIEKLASVDLGMVPREATEVVVVRTAPVRMAREGAPPHRSGDIPTGERGASSVAALSGIPSASEKPRG